MFCPECGNQIPDNAKFCVSCGYQSPQATIPPPNRVAQSVSNPTPKKSPLGLIAMIFGGLGLIVVIGLLVMLLMKNSDESRSEDSDSKKSDTTETAKPSPQTAETNTNSESSNMNAESSNATSETTDSKTSPESSLPAKSSTSTAKTEVKKPKPTDSPKKKPVDCDGKCYKVYDQCLADYRQFPDAEQICKQRQTNCLGNCP